ncbi:hypothetical protein MUK42_21659 [Musa troglodytarum]|uniref:Uncharacterized protein n=1 Tax=Musa troglodytarum TaxID=320322 RepID=A0A9E7G8R7_9LILI|nr:hypothetical protein MUK42_21659 [Musa troglodytarum]
MVGRRSKPAKGKEKAFVWKLPVVKTEDLGKLGPGLSFGAGCGVGVGIGLFGGAGLGAGFPGLQFGVGAGAGCGIDLLKTRNILRWDMQGSADAAYPSLDVTETLEECSSIKHAVHHQFPGSLAHMPCPNPWRFLLKPCNHKSSLFPPNSMMQRHNSAVTATSETITQLLEPSIILEHHCRAANPNKYTILI